MKVSVLVGVNRAHAYSFSDYLTRTGQIGRMYIGLPKALIAEHLRPFARTCPWLHVPAAALLRTRLRPVGRALQWRAVENFDRWVARRMEPCDVFMAMSSQGLHSRRAARAVGALTVCDRGSSHVLYQDELLAEEYGMLGVRYTPIDRRVIERELAEYAESDLIVVQSSFAYRSFVEKGVPTGKVAMVPLGVDPALFRRERKRDDVFRVLYVGEMSLRKGVPYLLDGLASLRLPNFELVLIGPMLEEIKPWFAKYEGRFRYTGSVRKTELYRYYSQASLFVLPTIEDGFGLVVCEALACGVPVITTPHCCGPDVITEGRNGFVIPIRDPKALRERVLFLCERPATRAEFADAALGRARSLNGWDGYGAAVVELYRSRLKDHR